MGRRWRLPAQAARCGQKRGLRGRSAMLNGLSVDVEDWFQVGAFETVIAKANWDRLPQRVERNTDAVLALFGETGVKATFFTLGWVAHRYPALIRRIVDAGHENASDGWDHQRVFTMDAATFRADRKSTRLKLQSLMRISYAVFCLKK